MSETEISSEWVSIGKVNKPIGLRGEISVWLFESAPVEIFVGSVLYIKGMRAKVENARSGSKGKIFLKLEGVISREDAEALRDEILEVNKKDIPPNPDGIFYHYQLLGMKVLDLNGLYMGIITEIMKTGANDVYVITNQEDSTEILAPAIAQTVHSADVAKGVMVVDQEGCIKQQARKERKKEK